MTFQAWKIGILNSITFKTFQVLYHMHPIVMTATGLQQVSKYQ